MINGLLQHRELLWELVKRDFIGRYKGSMLGVIWSLFNPLLMLTIYTVVFSVAFKAKWGTGEESKIAFAIVLFSGMIIHSFFAECLNRAPSLITSHPHYVKKVVFPIEILPWMAMFSALLHFLVSFGVLLVFCLLAGVTIHLGVLFTPIILLPLILMVIGFCWAVASLGVYLRDLSQVMGMVTTVALFLAPVFYPIDALPEAYRAFLMWNPITLPVIQLRDLMLWDKPIHWDKWAISLAIGITVCQTGYWWFQKSRRGFADVL
ncbi:MAG: sugar ABC transporter permease [Methylobacter sp.]|nr:MAG: sugar ABC transporter permease [Methylobacter sp.]